MSKPYATNGVLIGQGASLDPKALTPGTTGQVLTATTGAEPAFAAPATVSLTTGVTGILPLANGGTNQAVGAIAIMQFTGTAVAAGGTVFLGRDEDATEANVAFPCPVAGTIVAFAAAAAGAPSGSETFTYRIRIAGANAGGTKVITGAAILVIAATSQAITLGQLLCVSLVTSAAAAVVNHMVTLAIRVDG